MIAEQSNRTFWVMHPDDNVPVKATKCGYYQKNGRAIGLQLQFPNGRKVGFTYAEIRSSMAQAAEIF